MRALLPLGLVSLTLVFCGGRTVTSTPDSSSTGAPCVSGEEVPCTCDNGNPGLRGCPAITTGLLACSDCTCQAPGRSAGCCPGDGYCCPCVLGCDGGGLSFSQATTIDAFIACVCAPSVCGSECKFECVGEGAGGEACTACAKQAGMGPCAAQFTACQ